MGLKINLGDVLKGLVAVANVVSDPTRIKETAEAEAELLMMAHATERVMQDPEHEPWRQEVCEKLHCTPERLQEVLRAMMDSAYDQAKTAEQV